MTDDLAHVESETSGPSRTKTCLLWGCGVSLAVLLIAVVGFWALLHYGRAEIAPVAERFLDLTNREQYKEAYEMAHSEWKELQSYDELESFMRAVHCRLGSFEGGSVTGVHVNATTKGTFAQLSYSARFSKETCVIIFNLEKKENDWLIKGAHFESETLVQAYRCTKCENTNTVGAAYCARCGDEIDPLEDLR